MATIDQGEHSFEVEVLISGESVSGYTASEDLTAGEPVELTDDYEVSAAAEGGPAFAVVAYDVASGEQVAVINADGDNEARLEVSESITAGEALTPDGLGTFEQAVDTDGDQEFAIANNGASSGEVVEARLVDQQGDAA